MPVYILSIETQKFVSSQLGNLRYCKYLDLSSAEIVQWAYLEVFCFIFCDNY